MKPPQVTNFVEAEQFDFPWDYDQNVARREQHCYIQCYVVPSNTPQRCIFKDYLWADFCKIAIYVLRCRIKPNHSSLIFEELFQKLQITTFWGFIIWYTMKHAISCWVLTCNHCWQIVLERTKKDNLYDVSLGDTLVV